MQKGKYKARYCRDIVVYFENFAGKGIPQLSKFARSIGVTLRTLENWMDKYPKLIKMIVLRMCLYAIPLKYVKLPHCRKEVVMVLFGLATYVQINYSIIDLSTVVRRLIT